jgi:hypothetical protein
MDFSISIGIDTYAGLSPTPFCSRDAMGFHQVMQDVYGITEAQLLLRSDATFKRIESTFTRLSGKIGDHDRVFVFFAGHGQNIDGTPYLSCSDSDADEGSWHSSLKLIEIIASSGCSRAMYFIDACQSTLGMGSRRLSEQFSADAIKENIESAKFTCVFSSASSGQIADVSLTEKHGIWTSFLLNGLRGDDAALTEDRMLTNISLQNYLNIAVKDYCRKNAKCKMQNCFVWGKSEGEFLIREFRATVEKYTDVPGDTVKRAELQFDHVESIVKLGGFQKGRHTKPKFRATGFLNDIASSDLTNHIERCAIRLRDHFDLKSTEYKVYKAEDGSASFTCGYFEYSYRVDFSEDDLGRVKFTGSLTITDPDQFMSKSDGLDGCFDYWFDTLTIERQNSINIEKLIALLEAAPENKLYSWNYNADKTVVTLTIRETGREIDITEQSTVINFKSRESVRDMLLELRDASNALLDSPGAPRLLE